ncbi:tetratricopeptide repeat protein 36 [Lepeophtheirus salmonis]|uniref:tetratricopeptide repeat protein 36 n=1 Tax=Lepeophtheirus salmonis TaxID=72036 RepID=UPI001AEB22C4|nr:tetratricopeptide repeat protein 36-like [Lepeophtheirus salmonis]
MSTRRDREILNAVINPSIPIGEGVFDEENAIDESLQDSIYPDSSQLKESKIQEEKAIEYAERNNMNEALRHMKKAIELTPDRASCLNNSAQIHRLNNDIESATRDLNKAIEVSQGIGRSACQAYTQRGLIEYRVGKKEEALSDFQLAAKLGSSFAKSICTQLNPYAAMCNKMLKNVFKALEDGSERVDNPFDNPTCHKG